MFSIVSPFALLIPIILYLTVLGVVFWLVMRNVEAFNETWYVTCSYDAEGNLSGAECSSLGIDECKCPKSVLEHN